ncbi:MAG: hypothetical protein MZU95_05320 [Desulfomicrobium escambiense]|nr:hypothetical protein [Desulfomicrobium escambiense]
MSGIARSQIPIELDALWRFGEHFSERRVRLLRVRACGLAGGSSDRCDALGAELSRPGRRGSARMGELGPHGASRSGTPRGWAEASAASGCARRSPARSRGRRRCPAGTSSSGRAST